MSTTLEQTKPRGVVRNGTVVPDRPLPEGQHFELHPIGESDPLMEELMEEMAPYQILGAEALYNFERQIEEEDRLAGGGK